MKNHFIFILFLIVAITSLWTAEPLPLFSSDQTDSIESNLMKSDATLVAGVLAAKNKIEVAVTFFIPEKMYQQYNPTYFGFKLEDQKWIKQGKINYPMLPQKGKYRGEVTLTMKIRLSQKMPKDLKKIKVIAYYQLCNEAGLCLPPAQNISYLNLAEVSTDSNLISKIKSGETSNHKSFKTILLYLLMALAGGIILNVMPCVLPVLPIKAMSLIKQSQEKPKEIFYHTLLYSGGIITSMVLVAITLIIIQQVTGNLIMWGSLNQNNIFLMIMIFLLFIFALSLLDLFTLLPPQFSSSSKGGRLGAFASGLLVVLLGTSCTAPILAPVAGFFLSQPPLLILLFFITVGIGFAMPFWVMVLKIDKPLYLFLIGSIINAFITLSLFILYLIPAQDWAILQWIDQQLLVLLILIGAIELIVFIPVFKILKPGNWMNHLKKIMGLAMIAVASLFIEIFLHSHPTYIMELIWVLLMITLALGIYGKLQVALSKRWKKWVSLMVMTIIVILFAFWQLKGINQTQDSKAQSGIKTIISKNFSSKLNPLPFNEKDVNQAIENDQRFLILFSADWCMTCKANEKFIFNQNDTILFLKEKGIHVYYGDFTQNDPIISKWIKMYHRGGVPVYIFNPGTGKKPYVLPDALTKTLLFELISQEISKKGS